MAEFNVDLEPKNKGTSLADMLKMEMYSYQSDVARQEAAKAKAVGAELPLIQTFFKNEKNWKTPSGEIDVDAINSALPVLAPLTGHEYAAKYNQLAKNNTEAKDAKLNFDQKERNVVAQVYSTLGYSGVTNPSIYLEKLNNLKAQFPNSANIHRYADSAISSLKLGNPGDNPNLPKAAISTANELLSLEKQHEMAAPKAAITTVGGQNVVTTNTPSYGGSKPTVEATPLGGGGSGNAPTPASTQTNKPSSKLPKLIPEDESLKYTPQASGITNTNKFQDLAYERGNEIVKTANASVQAQKNLQQDIRKVEQHIQVASGSKIGQVYEKTKQYLLSNEKLDTLKKSIAQVQAKNAELMGLNRSDASQQLNEKLSGSENIDPKALEGVMQQVKAESKAAEMFTAGLNKYIEMRGDINGKIQADRFKSKWAEHYDPRIFQVFNISESNIPEAEKDKRISEITSKMTTKEYDKYKKDSEIIHRLHQGAHQ